MPAQGDIKKKTSDYNTRIMNLLGKHKSFFGTYIDWTAQLKHILYVHSLV